MAQTQRRYEAVKSLHQYYRDCLSQAYEFPGVGQFSPDLLRWVLTRNNTDVINLSEFMLRMHSPDMGPEKELALKLMFFTMLQANLALEANNRAPDYTLAPGVADGIKRGLMRILSLHPDPAYMVNTAQILYRIKEVEEVVGLAQSHPELFRKTPMLSAIMGFIHTMEGEYKEAMDYLRPLLQDAKTRILPTVALSAMTCGYFTGEMPTWPLSFETLDENIDRLAADIAKLPPLEMLQLLPEQDLPIVFVACNDRYFFQHALHLAYSMHATNAGKVALHLHLYAPSACVLAEIERLRERVPGLDIGVSTEPLPKALRREFLKAYFATVRFVRAHQVLEHYGSDLCIMDADALFNQPWETLRLPADAELVLTAPTHAPFWERITAGFIYCRPTPHACDFLARVAQFIARNIERNMLIWFTDQIALSVCDDRFNKDKPGVVRLPAETLMDTQHNSQALTWAVTANKAGSPLYNNARETLGRRYGQLPQATPEALYAHANRNGPLFFLQVGAMDGVSYDPIRPHVVAHGWRGILVEPLPDMMEKLKTNYAGSAGLVFENVAITEQDETRKLYRVTAEAVHRGVPHWALGMSTFIEGKLDDYKPHVVEQPVACMRLETLLAKYKPERIDILQIDTEGYDYKVLKQFDFTRYQPYIINLEWVNLNAEEKAATQALLLAQGYVFYENDMDLFAVKREMLFPS